MPHRACPSIGSDLTSGSLPERAWTQLRVMQLEAVHRVLKVASPGREWERAWRREIVWGNQGTKEACGIEELMTKIHCHA